MTKSPIPQEIYVLAPSHRPDEGDLEPRGRQTLSPSSALQSVDITNLQGQVNIFLQQLDQVMTNTPEKVGGFHLAEFEVSAGIEVQATGAVRIFLLANAEATAGVNAGLKFVFKRSS